MLRIITIVWNSFKMALQELRANKLRTFLSLFGITIGIFCIISVLATLDSLKQKLSNDLKAMGNNSIFIDKWEYVAGNSNYPWWKYVKRPPMKYTELKFLQGKIQQAAHIAFFASNNASISYKENELSNVKIYGATEAFNAIQTIDIIYGRYLSESDFIHGTPVAVIGYTNAENLFTNPENAVGKKLTFKNKKLTIVGVITKQGSSIAGGFQYDECLLLAYRCFVTVFNPDKSDGIIIAQAKPTLQATALSDELLGALRQVRKLSPLQDDNFSLNNVDLLGEQMNGFFAKVNLGGWAISILSLIVGAFGVANIMFVTVRERTAQIGLKKAIGAKRITILTEFLLESAFLCILGGFIGLGLVWLLTLALSPLLPFPLIIAPQIIVLALSICILLGIVSGIIPASIAAKMHPVVAIRTK